jgi:hypothetical protein
MDLLTAISSTSLGTWVRESESLLGYPTFILLHTVGLAILVGLSSIVALLVLGSAPPGVLAATRVLFPYMWLGFAINAASGLILMSADAPTLAMNRVMWVKFVFIVAVIPMLRGLRGYVGEQASEHAMRPASRGRLLAGATLACWLGAIVTGRLTAYIGAPDFPLG